MVRAGGSRFVDYKQVRSRSRVKRALVTGLGFTGLVVLAASYDPRPGVATESVRLPDAGRWAAGALHVHSSYTDGAGSVDEIAAAAARAGLDFVVLTDHWSLDALVEGEEGYRDGVLVLVGTEATTDAGHVLGLDLPASPLRFGRRDPEEVLGQMRDLGGFALAAHPDADRESFEWRGWGLAGYRGFEVFNAYSAYRRKGVLQSLAYLFVSAFWQTDLLRWELDWNPDLIDAWDAMLPGRKLAAWAGADAHGGIELAAGRFLRWPSYERVFRMARNYLLLDQPLTGSVADDRRLVYDALGEGRGYVALGDRADASGFRFWADVDGRRWPMGSDVELGGGDVTLHARAATADAELRLFRDGVLIAETQGGELEFATDEPGIYRVEAGLPVRRVGGAAYEHWILSNPIAVLPRARLAARIERNVLPKGDAMPFEPDDLREYPLILNVEPNPGCASMDLATGAGEEGALRLRFALGIPPRGEPDAFNAPYGRCAFADRRTHDLTGYAGIRFEARGDAIYRVTLLLSNRGPDPETESFWSTWFLTDRAWQSVTIPFSRLRGVRARDGDLDLSGVSQISFVLDTSNTRPGTAGQVEVRSVSLGRVAPP